MGPDRPLLDQIPTGPDYVPTGSNQFLTQDDSEKVTAISSVSFVLPLREATGLALLLTIDIALLYVDYILFFHYCAPQNTSPLNHHTARHMRQPGMIDHVPDLE
jgi:hypothetical protein